ncbi:MAG: nodulation protein NfeD [Candidatus Thermoplasmatota archaeon]|nr:nodulation protein NfeD [Candidatus Thermoplasmatota archaeon]MBU1940861.1 nodulation protein NfeD [Candidatus Thermoplasmatota archaeon]
MVTSAQNISVLVVEVDEIIDDATIELISEAIDEARVTNAQAIILLLDTPGGGADQTFEIADKILASEIPIIGYVYPRGATAWSAGTFILMSCHIAAMAPNTIIGSAQPIEVGVEGTRLINDSKRINALVEWITERADIYNRNTSLAAEFITKNRNVNASEALALNGIEYIAPTTDQLLDDIDGHIVSTAQGEVVLNTKKAVQQRFNPSVKVQVLRVLSNPVLTSLLLILGIFALLFGISAPGVGAEIFGIIAILLSLVGSGFSIPALSGIFIILGFILLLVEIFVTPGFGAMGIGGTICLIIGAIFLIPDYSNRGWLISMDFYDFMIPVVIALVVIIGIFFLFLFYKVLKIRTKKPSVGTFIGEQALTIDRITPESKGYVRFKGEYWQATAEQVIEPNTKVVIVDKDNSTLVIKPK